MTNKDKSDALKQFILFGVVEFLLSAAAGTYFSGLFTYLSVELPKREVYCCVDYPSAITSVTVFFVGLFVMVIFAGFTLYKGKWVKVTENTNGEDGYLYAMISLLGTSVIVSIFSYIVLLTMMANLKPEAYWVNWIFAGFGILTVGVGMILMETFNSPIPRQPKDIFFFIHKARDMRLGGYRNEDIRNALIRYEADESMIHTYMKRAGCFLESED